jgi:hypothetical protein
MTNNNNMIIKLVIVLIVIVVLFNTEIGLNLTSYSDIYTKISDTLFKTDLEYVKKYTQNEIKSAEEKGYTLHEYKINPNGGPDLSRKDNFDDFDKRNKTLYLFYSANCIHTQQFLPIWYRVKDRLPSNVNVEEHNSDDDQSTNKFQKYDIKSIPSVVLDYEDNTVIYKGDRSESDIEQFLRIYGITLNVDSNESFVDFNTNMHNNVAERLNLVNTNSKSDLDKEIAEIELTHLEADIKKANPIPDCPDITFDKQLDRTNNVFSFQIFDENGLYGYSKGGSGEPLDSFHAAYNCFDTYLSTLPQENLINKCAMKYKREIRDFGLCDGDKLDEIAYYGDKIKSGEMKDRIKDVDYDSNKEVVNSIKQACAI